MSNRKNFIFLIFAVLIFYLQPVASAVGISKGGKMELGVRNVGVWISPDCEYTVSIPKAMDNWMYPG